jgi:hypothetical protein
MAGYLQQQQIVECLKDKSRGLMDSADHHDPSFVRDLANHANHNRRRQRIETPRNSRKVMIDVVGVVILVV